MPPHESVSRVTSTRSPGRRVVRESAAVVVALAIAVLVVAHVATTARAALMFTDGDSMLPLLVMRSLDAGQPQDWAMSSVLFLPELLVFRLLWLLGLALGIGADGVVVLYGVVSLMGLYGALRVVSGSPRRARAPIAGALIAFTGFALLALCDSTASRDSFELSSLMVTATYYCATMIAVVLSVGLLRRALTPARRGRRPVGALTGIVLVAGVATLSNPLFLLWATAPLTVVLVVWAAHRRDARSLWGALALAAGSAAGYAGRIPLAAFIANDGWGYVDLSRTPASLQYYAELVAQRWQLPGGVAAVLLGAAMFAVAVAASARLRGAGERGARLVAISGWALPLFVVAAAIVLGTHAARYLQPAAFAPMAALVTLPEAFRMPRLLVPARIAAAAAAVAIVVVAAASGIPALVAAAGRTDRDLACVVSWVDRSGRVGGGQYWTVRLPKAQLSDPRLLVQVDDALRPYDWLVNRTDAAPGAVSFLVTDAQPPPFASAVQAALRTATIVACGRYTIADLGGHALALGPPRS